MIFLAVRFLVNVVVPYVQAMAVAALPGVLEIALTVTGIVIVCSAVGIRLNAGRAMANGIGAAIRWIANRLVGMVRWILDTTVRVVRWSYRTSFDVYIGHMSQGFATLLAVVTAIVVLAIIV